MSEPEELILEGAHFATRVARDAVGAVWPPRTSPRSAADEVRARLELFVTALFQHGHRDRAHRAAGAAHLAVTAGDGRSPDVRRTIHSRAAPTAVASIFPSPTARR